uniref:Uncharacterized protein n=1 Tax=Arion vulgaris TaxID=1028688 RepID=A0A0B6ZS24_9EUPU
MTIVTNQPPIKININTTFMSRKYSTTRIAKLHKNFNKNCRKESKKKNSCL